MAEAETTVMKPQAKDAWGKLEEVGRTLPRSLQREGSPAPTLTSDSWPPELGGE